MWSARYANAPHEFTGDEERSAGTVCPAMIKMDSPWWKFKRVTLADLTDEDRLSRMKRICLDDPKPGFAVLAERRIVESFLKEKTDENVVILSYCIDNASFEDDYDVVNKKLIYPKWETEVTNQAEKGKRVVVVFDLDNSVLDYRLASCIICLSKDRRALRKLPDNVCMVYSITDPDAKHNIPRYDELRSVCRFS